MMAAIYILVRGRALMYLALTEGSERLGIAEDTRFSFATELVLR